MSDADALLFVFTEPGDALPEKEYHEWYDEEHIPLRMALPDFKTGTRFVATDGQRPTWAASYDIVSLDSLKADAYTTLMRERSQREKDVLSRMEYLERRIYTVNKAAPVTASEKFKGHTDDMTLVLVSLEVPPEHEADFHRWYDEEHTNMLRKVPGWLRTRRFVLVDSGATGKLKTATEAFKAPPKFLALHEYASADGLQGPEWKAATSTEWRNKIFENVTKFERRILKVHKAF